MPRRHTLVNETEESNTFLIEWDPGSGLDWHDHGDSAASIIILQGRLHEHRAQSNGEPEGGTEVLYPDAMYIRHRGLRHRVENPFDEVAISIHTYSPPLVMTYDEALEIQA